MYIQDHPELFDKFLRQNRMFWREHGGAGHGGDILTDAAHDNPAYLYTNLLLAKYIQRIRGGRIVVVAKAWTAACPHYNADLVRRLAESFYVDEVVDVDQAIAATATGGSAIRAFEAAVAGKQGESLRRAVLDFEADRDPDIGWLLYDTYLRAKRAASIEQVSADLLASAAETLRTRDTLARCFQGRTLVAAVVGHYHYSPYAFLALHALRHEAPAYFQSLLLPYTVTEFRSVEDMRRGRPSGFGPAYRDVLQRAPAATLESFERRLFEVQEGARQFFKRLDAAGAATREESLRSFGLDPSRPTAAVFVPALCGAPHCFGRYAFDDFGHWLEWTLAFAERTPGMNFLVKPHPMDDVYDTTGVLPQLARRLAAASNIRFLPQNTAAGAVHMCADVVVTTNGTPGYEMVLRGVPTIAAAPSRYLGLGVAYEPATLEQYGELLLGCKDLAVDRERRRRALEFAFFEMVARRCHSIFLPSQRKAGTAEFWLDATDAVQGHVPEEDPFYRNVQAMLASRSPFLVNTDVIPGPDAPAPARQPVDNLLVGIHAATVTGVRALEDRLAVLQARVQEHQNRAATAESRLESVLAATTRAGFAIHFRAGSPFHFLLQDGWSEAEENGVWTVGGCARLRIPDTGSGRVRVSAQAFVHSCAPEREVAARADGQECGRRTFQLGEGLVSWDLDVPPARGVTVEFLVMNPVRPRDVDASSDDARQLGIALSEMRVVV